MCGIAGIISKTGHHISQQDLKSATDTLLHRGPEAEGFWINDNSTVGFGHRRLCIIDLSQAAAQPIRYGDRYTIIYNGEIYNYIELKEQLQKQGYSFYSQSDTEVIIVAYAAYGVDCLQKFDGMFAFAIWDEEEKILFAARDRFGEKPFFFFSDEQYFMFASEMKALWKVGVPKEVNKGMLYNFLTIGYTTNPADPQETFYNGIKKLPAASYLLYSRQKKEVEVHKYWQVYVDINNNISEEDAVLQFSQLFSDSVKKRLRSDVAIGTSLSGGLDSSAIVAFCDKTKANHYAHKCFTAIFSGFEKDEQQFASLVANHFGLEHHFITIKEDDVVSIMEQAAQTQEEPFSSASVLMQHKVYELAKQNGVTVLLDGQGADEVLAGYHKYYKWYWQELYRNKKLKKSELVAAKEIGVKESFTIKNRIAALLPEFTAGILQGRKQKQAYNHPFLNKQFAFSNKYNLYYAMPLTFDLNGALYFNTFVQGLEELLRLADRNSMAHSTEVRLPFLNHQLVEFLFTLPSHYKIHKGWTKWLLRKSVENKLPAEITWRRDKVGFEPPQKQWMNNKKVQEAIQQGKRKLVDEKILNETILKERVLPKHAHNANSYDWRYWSASYLF